VSPSEEAEGSEWVHCEASEQGLDKPVLDVLTGETHARVAQGWSSARSGDAAARFADWAKKGRGVTAPKDNEKEVFSCFRNIGHATVRIALTKPATWSNLAVKPPKPGRHGKLAKGKELPAPAEPLESGSLDDKFAKEYDSEEIEDFTPTPVKKRRTGKHIKKDDVASIVPYWSALSGEFSAWQNPVSISRLRDRISKGQAQVTSVGPQAVPGDRNDWIKILADYQRPAASQWKAPFLAYKVILHKSSGLARVQIFVSRLLFYLIADDGLRTLMKGIVPFGPVTEPTQQLEPSAPIFSKARPEHAAHNAFTTSELLCSQEHTGYRPYPGNPSGVALRLREYQQHTLQWMLDQESLPRGLNGCFWEKRSWGGPGQDEWFYYSADLGELRLEEPPLVRGGLVCEEMGMGKTLEFVSLILVTKNDRLPEIPNSNLESSGASLIVVPDTLVSQWRDEIKASIVNPADLKVATCFLRGRGRGRGQDIIADDGSEISDWKDALAADIIITTYNTVKSCTWMRKVMFKRICLDEMQEIRSPTTSIARQCKMLHSHSRWMISGTPLYTGINDLNGELAFLGVIPFSLTDKQDGFWGLRVETPFEEENPAALRLLDVLFRNVMMRHSKQQVYLSDPSQSILALPPSSKRFVGVPLTKQEFACYAYLDALTGRAADSEGPNPILSDRFQASGVELLRQFSLSPSLLNGGNGVSGTLQNVNNFAHSLSSQGSMSSSSSAAMSELLNEPSANGSFHAMPADEFRNNLLASASSGPRKTRAFAVSKAGGAGASGNAIEQNATLRLEEAQERLAVSERHVQKRLCSAKGGQLPKKQWKWAVQAVSSGKYLACIVFQKRWQEVQNIKARCPSLFTKGMLCVFLAARRARENRALEDFTYRYQMQGTLDLLRLLCSRDSSKFGYVEEDGEYYLDFNPSLNRAWNALPPFSSNPTKFRASLIERLLDGDVEFQELAAKARAAERQFDVLCSEGIADSIELTPNILESFPKLQFEAKFYGTGQWLPVSTVVAKPRTHFLLVTFLDGEQVLVAQAHVRLKQSYGHEGLKEESPAVDLSSMSLAKVAELAKLPRVVVSRLKDDKAASSMGILDAAMLSSDDAQVLSLFALDSDGANSDARNRRLERLQVFSNGLVIRELGQRRIRDGQRFKTVRHELKKPKPDLATVLSLSSRAATALLLALKACGATPGVAPFDFVCTTLQTKGGLLQSGTQSAVVESSRDKALKCGAKIAATVRSKALRLTVQSVNVERRSVAAADVAGTQVEVPWSEVELTSSRKSQTKRRRGAKLRNKSGDKHPVGELDEEGIAGQTHADLSVEHESLSGLLSAIRKPVLSPSLLHLTYAKGLGKTPLGKKWGKRTRSGAPKVVNDDDIYAGAAVVHESIIQKKQEIDELQDLVAEHRETCQTLGEYCKLLSVAIERGATNSAVVELQGLQALQALVDGSSVPKCSICLDELKDPVCTPCVHLFCKSCISQHIKASNHVGSFRTSSQFSCPLCRRALHSKDLTLCLPPNASEQEKIETTNARDDFKRFEIEFMKRWETPFESSSLDRIEWFPHVSAATAKQLLDKYRVHIVTSLVGTESLNAGFVGTLRSLCGVPSSSKAGVMAARSELTHSKLQRVIEDLKAFIVEGKVVVFSQFRRAIKHLGALLEQEGVLFTSITKGDSQAHLRSSISTFQGKDEFRILLLHASSAAAGLTLTVAKRVVLLEPFAKRGEEAQAINRVHRIGQKTRVESIVYFSRGTVEERMLAWHAHAQLESDSSDLAAQPATNEAPLAGTAQAPQLLRFLAGADC